MPNNKKWYQRLAEFLQDTKGNFSATRLVFLVYAGVLLGVWTYASINSHSVADIPQAVAIVFLSLMAGKAVQSLSGN